MWRLSLRDFSTDKTLPASTWTDVEQVLRRLDGFRHNYVSLEYVEGNTVKAQLSVVCKKSDKSGRVIVGIENSSPVGTMFSLDSAQSPDEISVPLTLALRTVRFFYLYQDIDPGLQWFFQPVLD
jgi:hypothetical protein